MFRSSTSLANNFSPLNVGVNFTRHTMLYHYTSLQGLIGVISSQSVWASHCNYLNDSSEYNQAINFAESFSSNIFMEDDYLAAFGWAVRDALAKMKPHDVYVTSFSEKSDLLSQWRGYCPQGSGICIGFDKDLIQQFCNSKKYLLHKCIYSHKEQENQILKLINECFEDFPKPKITRSDFDALNSKEQVDHEMGYRVYTENGEGKVSASIALDEFCNKVNELAPRMKNYGFHEESEWRIVAREPRDEICFRTTNSHLVPFIKLPIIGFDKLAIKEIIVGPNPNYHRCISSVEKLLELNGMESIKVTRSSVPFNSW